MKVNENPKELVLSIEQWQKLDKILNSVNLTQAQRRQFSDVKWHIAKFNEAYSQARQADEERWRKLRRGVSTVLRRLARPPFNNHFEVQTLRNGKPVTETIVVTGAYQATKRTELVKDSRTGIEFLAKPVPMIAYRIKNTCIYFQASALDFHNLILSRTLLSDGATQPDLQLDLLNPNRRIGV